MIENSCAHRSIRNRRISWLIRSWTVAFIFCASIGQSALADESEGTHCLEGCPVGKNVDGKPIQRSIYTLMNNAETKLADWVAYRVISKNFDCDKSTKRNWKRDPDLNRQETLIPKEYDESNVTLSVDRGHQAPLGSFKCHADAQMTNYLSNITPQFSKLNQGSWKKLEAAVRKLSESGTDVWVITGPLYEWPMAKLPSPKKIHAVPSAYWKIVAVLKDSVLRSSAFYFYQDTPKRAIYCDHMKTIDFIEEKTGLDFFPNYGGQDKLESSSALLKEELGC